MRPSTTSTLYGPDGEVKLTWRNKGNELTPAEITQQFIDACEDVRPPTYIIRAPVEEVEDTLTLYPFPDTHIGMLTWEPETGVSWDLKIAEQKITAAFDRVVAASPPSKWSTFLGLGDLFHSDNNRNETDKGHNRLDVEGRYPKIYGVVCRILVHCIDKLLLKHEHVDVRILPGNHDQHSSVGAAHYLAAWYRHEPRVLVDLSPDPFWYCRFDQTMLAATHGDQARASQMPLIMATRRSKVWGDTVHRYAFLGHLHRSEKTVTEGGGCKTEIMEAPIPKDAWSHGKGFLSGSTLSSITYSRTEGEICRAVRSVL